MGMGLSICQTIIESHSGRIWVSPAVNRGSVFQFELPINAASKLLIAAVSQWPMSASNITRASCYPNLCAEQSVCHRKSDGSRS